MADKKYSQYDCFTIPGHWWLPGEEKKIAGELHYQRGRLELRLFGAFHKTKGTIPFDHSPEETEVAVVHGESFSLQPITGFNAFYTSWRSAEQNFLSTAPGRIGSAVLHVHAAIVGDHVLSLDDQRYTKCRIQLRNLEGWLDDRPFSTSDWSKDGWKTEYAKPAKRQFDLPPPFRSLEVVSSAQTNGVPPMNRYEVVHRANFVITPAEPRPMEWFADAVGKIERLLTLLAGKQMQTERQWLYTAGDDDGSLLYCNRSNIEQKADYGPSDFLFRYPDVAERFERILSNWVTQTEKIQHALDLYFSSLRQPGAFLETRFLPMIQALEVYARADDQQTYIDPTEYEKVRPRIEASIPHDIDKNLRAALIGKLKYGNEYSLRKRLNRLVKSMEADTVKLFCLNPGAFVGGVVDTRNYLTHYSDDRGRVLQSTDLHWATIKLRTMFSLVLLKWAGLPEALICDRARADQTLGKERRQWANTGESGTRIDPGAL
ncbi:MAG: hypothetical protein KY475_06755 [Planctomycetes bacterium]|nr:hypothetical protein [Planctomycetota bacterium]